MLEAASMRTAILTGAWLALALALPAAAQQSNFAPQGKLSLVTPGASAWETVKGGRLRLVTTPAGPDGAASAAIEIELEPGFKTYWRNPGADGIPPQVGFLGSINVGEAKLTLPPPHVFRDASVTVGYKDDVSFPIAVRTADPTRSYRLVASGTLGFCADVCVPVPFRLEATPPQATAQSGLVAAGVQQMLAPSEGMKLDGARYDPSTGRLEVEATVPDTDVLLELVVANPDDRILPPAADAVHQKGDRAVFAFQLEEEQAPAEGEELDFTLIVARFGQDGRIGIEQTLAVARVE